MAYKEDALERAQSIFKSNSPKNNFVLNEINDLSKDLCHYIINIAHQIKYASKVLTPLKVDHPVLGLFQQTSTRTRASLDIAADELRAKCTYMDWSTTNIHLTSPIEEIKILSHLYSLIFVRMRDHTLLKQMSAASAVPFINAMSAHEHPTQALTDLFTIKDFFKTDFHHLRLAYIGDANNVARSLAHLSDKLHLSMVYSAPEKYRFSEPLPIQYFKDPKDAVKNADIIYTDTWISIGDESERTERLAAFADYQVNHALLSHAPKHALIMHCLPAHINEEISEDVFSLPRAIHHTQALNKQYIMQSIMIYAIHEYHQSNL